MALALSLLRLTLAAVFLLAAGRKVAQRRHGTVLLERFALPRSLAPAIAALPAVEAGAAVLLLAGRTARLGGSACAALLVLFSVLLLRNRASGRHRPCGCFGERGESLADRRPLWRNAALLAAALVVALGHPETALSAEAVRLGTWRAAALLVMVLAVIAAITSPLTRFHRRRRSGARSMALTTLGGEATTLGRLLNEDGPTLLLFLAPGCGACRSLLTLLSGGQVSPGAPPLIVAAPPAAAADDELMGALAGVSAIVSDDGHLAKRFGVTGTPTAVELDPAGRSLRAVVGAAEVSALLGRRDRAEPLGIPDALPDALTRRRVVTLALGVLAAFRLPLGRMPQLTSSARSGAAAGGGVRCPSCGSCSVCSYDRSTRKLTCRPCHQACSGKKLCASYANELAAFRSLAAWLAGRGFRQSSDPFTLGMEQGGKLTMLSSLTPLAGNAKTTPRAILVYDLTNGGERAWAALLDPRGRFIEVAAVSSGKVVSSPVPHPPAISTSHSASHAIGAEVVESAVGSDAAPGYNCADLCGFALGVGVALATLPAAAISAPEWVAAGFAASLFSSGLGLIGASGASSAVGLLAPLALGSSLVDGVIDGLTSLDTGLGQTAFCNALCKLETKYCCNYGCGCEQDYHACLARCPLDLQHPMAACNTYVRLGPETNWVQVTGIPSKCKV